jgi:hypothetical protein
MKRSIVASLFSSRAFLRGAFSTSSASFLAVSSFCAFLWLATSHQSPGDPLTAHEWGTFTSIAGNNGAAIQWLPLSGSTNLPAFVEHLGPTNFKGGLRGTIRMETPVLYFYAPRETTVSVHVSFANGVITEWYPHGSVPALNRDHDQMLAHKQTEGAITWNSVAVQPGAAADFPTAAVANPYFAARQTAAAPLSVDAAFGPQREKFLFYRGVSSVPLPVRAKLNDDETLLLQNHFPHTSGSNEIPEVILFERRGSQVGYRILGPLQDESSYALPTLGGSLDSLFSNLEGMLVAQGLYTDEAHAMLETWKSSWFEEGSRVLYLVPRTFVDSVLPLEITPSPSQITRVFVGRIELVTPATRQAVESALATHDRATLAKYGRFLEPILHFMAESAPDDATRDRLNGYLGTAVAYATFDTRDTR